MGPQTWRRIIEVPKTKDKEGTPKSINTRTAEGLQLKLEIEQHLKNKNIHKSNKTIAHGWIIG